MISFCRNRKLGRRFWKINKKGKLQYTKTKWLLMKEERAMRKNSKKEIFTMQIIKINSSKLNQSLNKYVMQESEQNTTSCILKLSCKIKRIRKNTRNNRKKKLSITIIRAILVSKKITGFSMINYRGKLKSKTRL